MVMIYKYEVNTEALEGSIEVKIPKARDRAEILKQVSIKTNKEGNVDSVSDGLDGIIQIEDTVKKHIVSIALTIKETNKKLKALEELEYYDEYFKFLVEWFEIITNGAKLGKGQLRA
jgi:hypothetical protein